MAETCERPSVALNSKIHSDINSSGYGSNKSHTTNSQSQRSSGSSKSQQSSLSSGSGSGYPHHPNASNDEHKPHLPITPVGQETTPRKRQEKKKHKLDKKHEKHETCPQEKVAENGKEVLLEIEITEEIKISNNTEIGTDQCTLHISQANLRQLSPSLSRKANSDSDTRVGPPGIKWQDYIPQDLSPVEDAFATVLTQNDGVVLYISPSITNILGFPKDMLVGRCFTDFVHPKDKMAFKSHTTGIGGVNFRIPQEDENDSTISEPFYCRLLQYHALKTLGFVVTDKTVIYHPFKLTMQLQKVVPLHTEGENETLKHLVGTSSSTIVASQDNVCLVLKAIKLKSAYQYSEEIPKNPAKFTTRHSASCKFGQMDDVGISYLGHLPQDLIGNCALDYYHPQDMELLKDTYEAVIQERGKPFRSKPYRFRVYNGTFAVLETDWSCFVNPFSDKLEFVIGKHRVIQGPINPNVFMPQDDDEILQLPDELVSDGKEMQNQIREMLTETAARRITDPTKQNSSRRRKDLALLMETLLEQMAKTDNSETGSCSAFSVMERDSVMLGEISPHTVDNSGSSGDQSSATPPSYNQLNYRENIERFFQSQPKTEQDKSGESDESGGESCNKMDTQNQSSISDSKSSPNIDSGSNIRNFSGSNESGNNDQPSVEGERESRQFGSGSLTQELLTRHNADMEKFMMQRHKEYRVKTPSSQKENRHRHPVDNLSPMHVSSRSIDNSSELVKLSLLKQRGRRGSPHKDRKSAQCCGHHTPAHLGLKRCRGNFSYDGLDFHNCQPKQPHFDFGNMAQNMDMGGGTTSLWPKCPMGNCTNGIPIATHSDNRYYYQVPNHAVPNHSSMGYSQTTESITVSCPTMQEQHPKEGQPFYGVPLNTHRRNQNTSNSITTVNDAPPFGCVPQGHQQQRQFLPTQVQLMPTGVIYQSIYGQQHPQILMPLGAMMHSSGQSIILGSHPSSKVTTIGATPTKNLLPISKSDSQLLAVSTSHSSRSDTSFIYSTNPSFTKTVGSCCKGNVASVRPLEKIASPVKGAATILRLPIMEEKATGKNRTKQMTFSSLSSTSTGSDESMTVSSAYSKSSSKEDMDQDQFISDQSMDSGKEGNGQPNGLKRNQVFEPLTEKAVLTPNISFRYTIPNRDLSEVLRNDMKALQLIGKQSPLVNDQLTMLYNDLADDGLGDTNSGLYVDEGISNSSNSSGGEEKHNLLQNPAGVKKMTKRRTMNVHQYTRVAIIHEENAPFPPENLCNFQTTSLLEKVAKVLTINSPIPAMGIAAKD